MINPEKIKAHRNFKGINSCHDFDHTKRVLENALHIARKEKADIGIVQTSALLHDIARKIEDKTKGKVDHAVKGSQIARKMLTKHGFSESFINAVCHSIETHRFRKSKKPQSLEAKVLYDADKLDSIGAVGIARAFLFAGHLGAKLHDRDIDIVNTKEYSKDDTAYREYMVKLRHVKGRMLTKEGKKLALKRHAFMEKFFKQLDMEIEGVL